MSDKASPPTPGASPADGAEKPREAVVPPPPPPRVRGTLTFDEVAPLWEAFRGGAVVPCPGDAGSLALSVDGNNSYRFVCTLCGTASSWFEAAPAGIRLRTIPPGPEDETADL